MTNLCDCPERVHVKGWNRSFHVIFNETEVLLNVCLQIVHVCFAIGSSLHEWSVFVDAFVAIPFGIGGKEPVFIDLLANIRGFKLGFEGKSDWNWLSHPLIVQGCKERKCVSCSMHTFMIDFKKEQTKKLAACQFVGRTKVRRSGSFGNISDKRSFLQRVIIEGKTESGVRRQFGAVKMCMEGVNTWDNIE